mmetsp:Transcript_1112/g.2495  ORF Transcript_1112/g.2495 Transcript_1112/m.2495 type:complete len:195 (-) Transcript_1112:102-686(-)
MAAMADEQINTPREAEVDVFVNAVGLLSTLQRTVKDLRRDLDIERQQRSDDHDLLTEMLHREIEGRSRGNDTITQLIESAEHQLTERCDSAARVLSTSDDKVADRVTALESGLAQEQGALCQDRDQLRSDLAAATSKIQAGHAELHASIQRVEGMALDRAQEWERLEAISQDTRAMVSSMSLTKASWKEGFAEG